MAAQEEESGVFETDDIGEIEMDFPEDWMVLDEADEDHTEPKQFSKSDPAGGDTKSEVSASKSEAKGEKACQGPAAQTGRPNVQMKAVTPATKQATSDSIKKPLPATPAKMPAKSGQANQLGANKAAQAGAKQSQSSQNTDAQASKPTPGKIPVGSKAIPSIQEKKSHASASKSETSQTPRPLGQIKGAAQSKSCSALVQGQPKASNPPIPTQSRASSANTGGYPKTPCSSVTGQAKPPGSSTPGQAKPSSGQTKPSNSTAPGLPKSSSLTSLDQSKPSASTGTQGKTVSRPAPKPGSAEITSVPAQTSQAAKTSASSAIKPACKSIPGNQTQSATAAQTATIPGKVAVQGKGQTNESKVMTDIVQSKYIIKTETADGKSDPKARNEQSVDNKPVGQSVTPTTTYSADGKKAEDSNKQQSADSAGDSTSSPSSKKDHKLAQDVVVKVRRLDEVKNDEKAEQKQNETDAEIKSDKTTGKNTSVMTAQKVDVQEKPNTASSDESRVRPVPQKVEDGEKSGSSLRDKPSVTTGDKSQIKPGDKPVVTSSAKPQNIPGNKLSATSSTMPQNKPGNKPSANGSAKPQNKGGDRPMASSSDSSQNIAGDRPRASGSDSSQSKAGEKPRAPSTDRSENKPSSRYDEKASSRSRRGRSRENVPVRSGERRRSHSRSKGCSRDRSRGRSRDRSVRYDRSDERLAPKLQEKKPTDSSSSPRPVRSADALTSKAGERKPTEAKQSDHSSITTKSSAAVKKTSNSSVKKEETCSKQSAVGKKEDQVSENGADIVELTTVVSELGVKERLDQGLWRFSLRLCPLELGDLAKQDLRNVLNTSQDIVIIYKNQGQNKKKKGVGYMYFNRLLTTKCTMQKLFLLQLTSKKIEIEISRKRVDSKEKDTAIIELDLTTPGTLGTTTATNIFTSKSAAEDKNVHISNVPKNTTQELLFVVFPTAFSIQMPRDGKDKGTVVMQFRSAQCADDILRCYTSVTINKVKLKLSRMQQSQTGSRKSQSGEQVSGRPVDSAKKPVEIRKRKDVKDDSSPRDQSKGSDSQAAVVYQIPVLNKRTISAMNATSTQLKKGRVSVNPEQPDVKRPRLDQPPPPIPPHGFGNFPVPTNIPPPIMPPLQGAYTVPPTIKGAYTVPPPALPPVVQAAWPVSSGMNTTRNQIQMAGPQNSMNWQMPQQQGYVPDRELQGTEAISPEWDDDGSSRFHRDGDQNRRGHEKENLKRPGPVHGGHFSRRRSLSPARPQRRGSPGRHFEHRRARSPGRARHRSISPCRISCGPRFGSPLRRGVRWGSRSPARGPRQSYSPISPERKSRSPRRPDHGLRRQGRQGMSPVTRGNLGTSPGRRGHSPSRKEHSPFRQRRRSQSFDRQAHRNYSPVSQARLSRSPGRRALNSDRHQRDHSPRRRSHSPQRKVAVPRRGRSSEKQPIGSVQKTLSPGRDARRGHEGKTSVSRHYQGRSVQNNEARLHHAGQGETSLDEQAALLHREITKALASRHSPHSRPAESKEHEKSERPAHGSGNRGGWTGFKAASQSAETATSKQGLFPAAFTRSASKSDELFPSAKNLSIPGLDLLLAATAEKSQSDAVCVSSERNWQAREDSEAANEAALRQDALKAFGKQDFQRQREAKLPASDKRDSLQERDFSGSRQGASAEWRRDSSAQSSPMFDQPRNSGEYNANWDEPSGSGALNLMNLRQEATKHLTKQEFRMPTTRSQGLELNRPHDTSDRSLPRLREDNLGSSGYQQQTHDVAVDQNMPPEKQDAVTSKQLLKSALRKPTQNWPNNPVEESAAASTWSRNPPGLDRRILDRSGLDRIELDRFGMDRPGMDHLGVDRPGTDRSGVDRSGMDHSRIDHHGMDRPGMNRQGMERSDMNRSGMDRPWMDRPGIDHPGMDRPGLDHPRDHPRMDYHRMDRPGFERPGMERPGLERPGMERPGMERPGMDQRGFDYPGPDRQGPDSYGPDRSRMDRFERDSPMMDKADVDRPFFDQQGPDGGEMQRPPWRDQPVRPVESRGGVRVQNWNHGRLGPEAGYDNDTPMLMGPNRGGNDRDIGRGRNMLHPDWEMEGPVPGRRGEEPVWPAGHGDGLPVDPLSYGEAGAWLPPPHRPPHGQQPYGPPHPPY